MLHIIRNERSPVEALPDRQAGLAKGDGSGKKYKRCGLLNTEEHQKLMGKK